MKTFDFNIHLSCCLKEHIDRIILDENNMFLENLKTCYAKYKHSFKNNINAGNFMLFNQELFVKESLKDFIYNVKDEFKGSIFTALIDFRRNDVLSYLDKAIEDGVDAIKFHSYNQKISQEDFTTIAKVSQYAQNKNIMILIDTSYGTSKMYDHDNLKLACFISEFITRVPIVLLHSGGARIIEAMLLAEDKKNIFLDTSFSILYLLESSIEKDFAFTYKKIGTKRVLYGSDTPYMDIKISKETTLKYLQKYSFKDTEIEDIFFNNAYGLKEYCQ